MWTAENGNNFQGKTIEFSLNDCLSIDTFLDVEVKKNSPLLSVGWYQFRAVSVNANALYITGTSNVLVARWVIHLVTIPVLDFVMIR